MSEALMYRPEEAAEMLGIGRSKMFELMAAGQVASVRIGRSRRITRQELERFVAALSAPAA